MSSIKKRSISLSGHRTSYSIEDEFQDVLMHMATQQSTSLAGLIANIDDERGEKSNLSSSLRIAALKYSQSQTPTDMSCAAEKQSVNSGQTEEI